MEGGMADDNQEARQGSASAPEIEAIKQLREELRLEIVPQKLLRQYSVNIPPRSASEFSDAMSCFGGRGGVLHSSPTVVENMLERWEQNRELWRIAGSCDSLADIERQQQPDEEESDEMSSLMSMSRAGSKRPSVCGSGAGTPVARERRRSSIFRAPEAFDVTFGDGFLGLELVWDEVRREVMVKDVHDQVWMDNVLEIPPGVTLTRGLILEAINGVDIRAESSQQVLDMLEHSKRPMVVRFHRNTRFVVCKLCECKVDAFSLNEHTEYCVMSTRIELEADVINNSLMKLVKSINANLTSEGLRPYFHEDGLHFYHTLRVVSIQAASCDVASIDSFALCCRLIKIVDRLREQEPESSNFVMERGIKFCSRIRNLIHAKMSKIRSTHKVIFQQGPFDVARTSLQRTKSLEELEKCVSPLPPLSVRQTTYRVSIRDFQIIKPISKGAFGKVYLARKKTTGDQYAIKVLGKEHLKRKKQVGDSYLLWEGCIALTYVELGSRSGKSRLNATSWLTSKVRLLSSCFGPFRPSKDPVMLLTRSLNIQEIMRL